MNENELQHYGVIGMKWGIHRATSKLSSNPDLYKKALKYDKKAAVARKKSEKLHAKKDLETANQKALKAATLRKRAAVLEKRSSKTENDYKAAKLHKKSENLKYKAAKREREANTISKTKAYGAEAMKYSIKSDRFAAKAAKARKKIANNEFYVARMKKKISQLSKEDLAGAYQFINNAKIG